MSNFVEKIYDFVIKYPENVEKYLKTIWGFYIYYRNVLYRNQDIFVLYRPNFGENFGPFVMSNRIIKSADVGDRKKARYIKDTLISLYTL